MAVLLRKLTVASVWFGILVWTRQKPAPLEPHAEMTGPDAAAEETRREQRASFAELHAGSVQPRHGEGYSERPHQNHREDTEQ
jgi:hypothetical protein